MTDSTKLMSGKELSDFVAQIHHDLWEAAQGKSPYVTKHRSTKAIIKLFDEQKKLYADAMLERLIAQQWSFDQNDDSLAVPTRYIESERQRNRGEKG